MTCSAKKKLTRGIALMAIAVAFAGANVALGAEPNDDALAIAAPTPAASPKRELVSAPTDPRTEPALPRAATEPVKLERPPLRQGRAAVLPRAATEPVKLERPPLRQGRARRDDDGPRVREVAAGERRTRYAFGPVWHRNGGGIGLILGVGF